MRQHLVDQREPGFELQTAETRSVVQSRPGNFERYAQAFRGPLSTKSLLFHSCTEELFRYPFPFGMKRSARKVGEDILRKKKIPQVFFVSARLNVGAG
jgi:hypothetical protein